MRLNLGATALNAAVLLPTPPGRQRLRCACPVQAYVQPHAPVYIPVGLCRGEGFRNADKMADKEPTMLPTPRVMPALSGTAPRGGPPSESSQAQACAPPARGWGRTGAPLPPLSAAGDPLAEALGWRATVPHWLCWLPGCGAGRQSCAACRIDTGEGGRRAMGEGVSVA